MKTIITAALTGVLATRDQCPAIPYTPEEIAREARRSVDAGASIVHVHARQNDGKPAFDVDSYRRIAGEIRKLCPDVILNFSTGAVGLDRETRIAPVRQLQPDMAALNMGSMNYAIYSPAKKRFYHDHIFENRFGDIRFYLEAMVEAGCRPEMECFDRGHIHNAEPLRDLGVLRPPLHFSLVMGVLGGLPASPRELVHQVDALPPGSHWQVIGIGLEQWRLVATAVCLEGHVRVGLEDNFYLRPGHMAASNGELVEKAARLVGELGGEVASIEEARGTLSLPLRTDVGS
ncbi:MAG: 3-keto-5-aminohexanoate cleavage protein [Armatimonadetes bacterium]|nr:3-keto-5-aminohexanoate cleavage protein [Armatimonadota bacterium]